MIKLSLSIIGAVIILAGCVSSPKIIEVPGGTIVNNKDRNEQLLALTQWKVEGKIAFLQKNKRDSANLQWSVDQKQATQSLNMSTYLGINVLKLEQNQHESIIEVDGETYQSDDLDSLIWQLTGFTLPTNALHYWIKGIAYLPTDSIEYNANGLPYRMLSQYDNVDWQVNYQAYQTVNSITLPQKVTIKQDELTIKLMINHWSFNSFNTLNKSSI